MTRQVLNEGLSLTEGTFDKGNLIDLMSVINKSDANFEEVYDVVATSASATAAELTAAVSIADVSYPPYDLRRYGVDFSDSSSLATSNTTILNALGAAAWTSDVTFYWPPGKCRINDTVTFSNIHISHNFDNRSTIEYYGTADRVAVVQGNASTSQGSKNALGGAGIVVVNHTTNPYTNEAFIGVQLLGTVQNSRLIIRQISGFTIGLQLRPSTSGITYNVFDLYSLLDNKYNIDLHSFAASAFINENIFNGGSFKTSALSASIDSYGVRFIAESGAYTGHNRNIFNKCSFELDAQSNSTGGVNRTPVLYSNAGAKNEFRQARVETGRGYIVDIVSTTATVNTNIFEGVVLSGTWTGYQRESDGGLAYGNSFTDVVDGREFQKPAFRSGDLLKRAFGTDTAKISVKGHFFQATASSTATYTGTAKIFKDYIVITSTSNAIGFDIDTTYYKSFLVRKDFRSGFGGRTRFVCYDSTGAILDSGGGGHPYAVSNSALAYSTAYGNSYGTQSDGTGSGLYFSVGSGVARVRVLFTGGSTAMYLRSYELYALTNADNPKPLRLFTGLSQSDDEWYVNGDPSTILGGGFIAKGERVPNSGGLTSYVCTAEGWNASAWLAATGYLIEQLVTNDTGKTYQCLTAGTSAGSGGPTGTATSGITDGTNTVWGYIGTQATWVAQTLAVSGIIAPTDSTHTDNWSPTSLSTAREIRWAGTASTGFGGLVAQTDGTEIVLTNGTTDYLLWLENQNTNSTAANRFILPRGFPAFLMPGDQITLKYDGTALRWRVMTWPNQGQAMGLTEFSDLIASLNGPFASTVSGTGATIANTTFGADSTEKAVGAALLTMGTTTTGRSSLGVSTAQSFAPTNFAGLSVARVATSTAVDGTETYSYIIGFQDAVGGTWNDGAAWEYRWNGSAPEWSQTVMDSATPARSVSGSPSPDTTTYFWMIVYVNPGWTRADFIYSQDSMVFTKASSVSSGLPTATHYTSWAVTALKSAGTTSRSGVIDLLGYRLDGARG